jgi:nucleotide-binding universal stress UspA family protein
LSRRQGNAILSSSGGKLAEVAKESAMYPKILVPVDGSDASTAGLNEAIKVAKQQGAELRLLHIVELPDNIFDYGYSAGMSRKDVIASLCEVGKRILSKAETTAREQGLTPECAMFESGTGSAAQVILTEAQQWGASLIVLGSHAGYGRLRVGHDTAEILAECAVPVLLVRAAPGFTEHVEIEPRAITYSCANA